MGVFTYSLVADTFAACNIEDVFHLANRSLDYYSLFCPRVHR